MIDLNKKDKENVLDKAPVYHTKPVKPSKPYRSYDEPYIFKSLFRASRLALMALVPFAMIFYSPQIFIGITSFMHENVFHEEEAVSAKTVLLTGVIERKAYIGGEYKISVNGDELIVDDDLFFNLNQGDSIKYSPETFFTNQVIEMVVEENE